MAKATENADTQTPDNSQKPPERSWISVDNRKPEDISGFIKTLGLTPNGEVQLAESIKEQTFLSEIKFFDLSPEFNSVDPEIGIEFSHLLEGPIYCVAGTPENPVIRGFTCTPGVVQRAILVSGSIYTRLPKPHPVTHLIQGAHKALFLAIPETTPGIRREVQPYRPMLRFKAQHIIDGSDDGDLRNNVLFTVNLRGKAGLNDQLPQFVYLASLRAGLTEDDLLFEETDTYEIERRRINRNRNRLGRNGVVTQAAPRATTQPAGFASRTGQRDPSLNGAFFDPALV